MTVHNTFHHLQAKLTGIYDDREAANIADWVMEKITGWKKMDRVVNKQVALSASQQQQLARYTAELLRNRPVQYVLEEAWFIGLRFFVNESVLIPRPETEELVDWILQENYGSKRILDIGTGSGCIPVTLKKKMPEADVYACDISKDALEIATLNARSNGTDILFIDCDILDESASNKLPYVDIIASNPPYIPLKDKVTMRSNVLDFEPHQALFVSDEDALLFYRKIVALALKRLSKGGSVYLEIHEELGSEVMEMLQENGFSQVVLRKDLQGKDRMIKAAY
ncbi:MAG: peptide chain release factor N(5)-glutamine methyltransferase [Chitinophagaceae bacterium]|nr:peptide chain release factor N(5)-glutamine methyltransferase [Chitinophagaceae bacterium]